HVAAGPTLIHQLVGIALAGQAAGVVADLAERPDAPNLYWALTTLPRPLIDLRGAAEWEYRMLEMQFPDLADLDRDRPAGQWDVALRRYRTGIREIAFEGAGADRKLPDWFPKTYAPDAPAADSPDLPAARAFVGRTAGLSAEQVAAMPPARVLLRYTLGGYRERRDLVFRAFYLPPAQALPLIRASDKLLLEPPQTEGQLAARVFLPAVARVVSAQARADRNLSALRVVEALRMYAAAHDGRLPDRLGDMTETPLPDDPGTGKPFVYTRAGDTSTITSQVPDDPIARSGIRYRVTVRKK
ncbi:MAG TPA: hypothetical protein VH092_06180, partial [Urbifossiella sp.]|nr:hypothetical protein [Urbifossiella sp.]